ncbi:MAG: hypothetical protein EXX96DRAFT_587322 [Benjaminiella poitrasii]|nr:MAG: hypothetical protein EXX96DRAFT_587322 [Benjaminiella poitrasii]
MPASKQATTTQEREPLDPPPPYTSVDQYSEPASSSSNNSRSSSPITTQQPSSSVHEQFGLLGQQPRKPVYNTNKGPIGNILSLASGLLDSGKTNTPAATIAKNFVEDLVNSRSERREDRQQARSLRKEQRHKRREAHRDRRDERRSSRSFGNSGSSEASSSRSRSSSTTTKKSPVDDGKLRMKQSNSQLVYNDSWSGRSCDLSTSNGQLEVHGSLFATSLIELQSSNGHISVDGDIRAHDVQVVTRNGPFMVHGASLTADRKLKIESTNAPLQFENTTVRAKKIQMTTKNGPVMLRRVYIEDLLEVKSKNGPMEIHVKEIISSDAEIHIETTNAPIIVYLPKTFAGHFDISSSSSNAVTLVKTSDESKIKFERNEKHKKSGICKHMGIKSSINVYVKTSNAPVTLHI